MYSKIEQQLGRTLNCLEVEKLDNLVETYSINEIAECFKSYPGKPLNYIIQVLKSKPMKQTTDWLNKEIINEPIDKETEKEFAEFNNFLEDFRNGII